MIDALVCIIGAAALMAAIWHLLDGISPSTDADRTAAIDKEPRNGR